MLVLHGHGEDGLGAVSGIFVKLAVDGVRGAAGQVVGVFNIDRQSGERHVTGDGFLVDLHRDLAEGHGHRIILRQLEAQVHAALGVAHHRLIAHVLQQQLFSFFVFFHNIKRAGVAAGDFAALGQDHLQQFAGIVLRAERGPNLVELIDLARGEGQPGVHLLAAGYQVNVVQGVVNHALNQRNGCARNQVGIDQPVEAVIFEPGLAEAEDADVGRVQVASVLLEHALRRGDEHPVDFRWIISQVAEVGAAIAQHPAQRAVHRVVLLKGRQQRQTAHRSTRRDGQLLSRGDHGKFCADLALHSVVFRHK